MKILTLSDTHGQLPAAPEGEYDLFIHAGDICPNWSLNWNEDWPYQSNWLNDVFNPWLSQIPAKRKLIAFGNHDSDRAIKDFCDIIEKVPNATAHVHEEVEYAGQRIFISSYSHADETLNTNNRWGFGGTEAQLERLYEQIPVDTDILVTHGPAFGLLDATKWDWGYVNIGSKALQQRLFMLTQLKLHVFGHEHHHGGMKVKMGKCVHLNSAKRWSVVEI